MLCSQGQIPLPQFPFLSPSFFPPDLSPNSPADLVSVPSVAKIPIAANATTDVHSKYHK